jgi:hypothetical protein
MKVLKHFVYIKYRCGVQSVVVYSLNHDTITSFGLHLETVHKRQTRTNGRHDERRWWAADDVMRVR